VIILEESPFSITRQLLERTCNATIKESDRCGYLIKQKTLLEFGALSFTLAIAREIVQSHGYMGVIGVVSLVTFLCIGYFWLTVHRARQFNWVKKPFPCFRYMCSLIAMSAMISSFGAAINGQVSIIAKYVYNQPLAFFLIIAAIMGAVIFFLQLRKAEREAMPIS